MSTSKFLPTLGAVVCLIFMSGCIESQSISQPKAFDRTELDACLAIVVDMSSSFADSWEERAYNLFVELMDQFFTEGMSIESKVVLGQLSGNKSVVLFEGRPAEVRERFQSAEDLNAFLREHSDPSRSPVFEATQRAVDYVSSIRGVTENTRVLTVILSDMGDTEQDADKRRKTGHKMLKSLRRYREAGGALALYFVAPSEMSRWKTILGMAGFDPGSYVIESTLVAHPQLPRFD